MGEQSRQRHEEFRTSVRTSSVFSSFKARSLRASETSMPPNFAFQLKKVALLMPCFGRDRLSSPRLVLAQYPDELLFREPRTLRRPYPSQVAGLYLNLEEVQGLRSPEQT